MRRAKRARLLTNPLVIDKSWLVGVSRRELERAVGRFRLVLPEILLYELLTTDAEQRVACMTKLFHVERAVSTMGTAGSLFRYEGEHHRPCGPLLKRCHGHTIGPLRKLAAIDYIPSADELEAISSERELREQSVIAEFARSASDLCDVLPEARAWHGQRLKELFSKVGHLVEDQRIITSLYNQVRSGSSSFPRKIDFPEKIDARWALFRRMQAHILMTAEFIRRYDLEHVEHIPKKLVNLYLDTDYLVLGALAGALATRDKLLAAMLKLMVPQASVVSGLDENSNQHRRLKT